MNVSDIKIGMTIENANFPVGEFMVEWIGDYFSSSDKLNLAGTTKNGTRIAWLVSPKELVDCSTLQDSRCIRCGFRLPHWRGSRDEQQRNLY